VSATVADSIDAFAFDMREALELSGPIIKGFPAGSEERRALLRISLGASVLTIAVNGLRQADPAMKERLDVAIHAAAQLVIAEMVSATDEPTAEVSP
jgi:hypothetical protein